MTVVERNPRMARKVMITGKGRCNVTNACSVEDFIAHVPQNGRFLYSALSAFGPGDTMALLEKMGVPLKTERGNRVFPCSDKAVDVVDGLVRFAKSGGCLFRQGRAVRLLLDEGVCCGVELESGERLEAYAVVICTGGLSYPLTGSTGDGYELARPGRAYGDAAAALSDTAEFQRSLVRRAAGSFPAQLRLEGDGHRGRKLYIRGFRRTAFHPFRGIRPPGLKRQRPYAADGAPAVTACCWISSPLSTGRSWTGVYSGIWRKTKTAISPIPLVRCCPAS